MAVHNSPPRALPLHKSVRSPTLNAKKIESPSIRSQSRLSNQSASGDKIKRAGDIQVITNDLVRSLHSHDKPHPDTLENDKNKGTITMKDGYLQSMKEITEALQASKMAEEQAKKQVAAAEAAFRRKEHFSQLDAEKPMTENNDFEEEERLNNQALLQKAKTIMENEDDDIKFLNELILDAKCYTVRDLQLKEKAAIAEEQRREETRLDKIMDDDRVADLDRRQKRDDTRKKNILLGAAEIRKQLSANAERVLLEKELKEQETIQWRKEMAQRKLQDQEEREERLRHQRDLREEGERINLQLLAVKAQREAERREEDRLAMEYTLKKAQQEKEHDEMLIAKRNDREKEHARLLAAQEKVIDDRGRQDELRAKRATEALELGFRQKAKEKAEKEARQQREMKEDRERQLEARARAEAMEVQKNIEEFNDSMEQYRREQERVRANDAKRQGIVRKNAEELRQQIAEHNSQKKKDREQQLQAGASFEKQRSDRDSRLSEIKASKLEELRKLGVSEKHIQAIERQMVLRSHQLS